MDNIELRLFGEAVDLDAIVEEVGFDWRAVFERFGSELDLIFASNEIGPEPS
jgi:hypothetical protein